MNSVIGMEVFSDEIALSTMMKFYYDLLKILQFLETFPSLPIIEIVK